MGFFDKFFGTQKSISEKIKEDRDKVRKVLENNLKQLGFTSLEIKEVQDIITMAEDDIQILKDSLIEVKTNNADPAPFMKKVTEEIRARQERMSIDIKKKVQQIKKRKADFKKELQ